MSLQLDYSHASGVKRYTLERYVSGPLDPALLDVPYILTPEYEESVFERDPELDTFTLGAQEFIPWFAACWNKAGGTGFRRQATIAEHDNDREFNLVTAEWQDRYSGF
jgi:hypothetical protein